VGGGIGSKSGEKVQQSKKRGDGMHLGKECEGMTPLGSQKKESMPVGEKK